MALAAKPKRVGPTISFGGGERCAQMLETPFLALNLVEDRAVEVFFDDGITEAYPVEFLAEIRAYLGEKFGFGLSGSRHDGLSELIVRANHSNKFLATYSFLYRPHLTTVRVEHLCRIGDAKCNRIWDRLALQEGIGPLRVAGAEPVDVTPGRRAKLLIARNFTAVDIAAIVRALPALPGGEGRHEIDSVYHARPIRVVVRRGPTHVDLFTIYYINAVTGEVDATLR